MPASEATTNKILAAWEALPEDVKSLIPQRDTENGNEYAKAMDKAHDLNQIINKNAYICLTSVKNNGVQALEFSCSIYSCYKPLCCGFLITACTVKLTGTVKPRNIAHFKRGA